MPTFRKAGRLALYGSALLLTAITTGFLAAPVNTFAQEAENTAVFTPNNLIPKPVSVTAGEGVFTLDADTRIILDQMELAPVGQYLAALLNPAFGSTLEVTMLPPDPSNVIVLSRIGSAEWGDEGYRLTVTPETVTIEAHAPAGAFYAVQTLRQLLPAALDGESAAIPAVVITDKPRFVHRGVMLDVTRHFFTVEDVKGVIDLLAVYKLNRLHLHLSDDQGWRIEIKSWPNLTAIGSLTAVGGAAGGFYTQEQYSEIVAYAAAQFIEIVPEIDMPGHTNAALNAYPELNCDGVAPQPYTGTEVGFSTLCVDKEITYEFIDDVIGELAALTPGKYIHIGGDESKATDHAGYMRFVERVLAIVQSHGKQAIGWEEIGQAELLPGTVAQHWFGPHTQEAVDQGAQVILSPSDKIYLDMKYNDSSPLGLSWAGLTSVFDNYHWEPTTALQAGLRDSQILGVEAALWSETLLTSDDIEYMLFPRLLGVAEVAWSPKDGRAWDEYKARLVTHGARLDALGVNFFRDPALDWE